MLFDLRSRGRRRTVQGVYLGLAILMGGGLVLFGVGTGNGIGGLLNGIGGSGSGSSKPVVTQAEKAALRETQLQPTNPSAWYALVQARYEAAGQDANTSTNTYTAAGVTELQGAGQAWQRYLQLTKKPDWSLAVLMAQAYQQLGNYPQATNAWQIVTQANPTAPTYFEYLATAAWKAKENDLGDLAEAKAISLTPKPEQAALRTQLQALKTQSSSSTASATGG